MPFQPSTFTTVPTDWARIDLALDELLCLDPSEWPAAIDRLAQGDAGLADELHHLLATALEGHRQYGVRPAGDGPAPRWRDLDKETVGMAAQLRTGADDGAAGPSSRPPVAATARPAPRTGRPPASPADGRWRLAAAVIAGVAGAVLVHWLGR